MLATTTDRVLRRTAAVLRRWHRLPAVVRRRLDYECRAIAVREARRHVAAGATGQLAAIDRVLALLDLAADGHKVSRQRWKAAAAEAGRAALAADGATLEAAWAALADGATREATRIAALVADQAAVPWTG